MADSPLNRGGGAPGDSPLLGLARTRSSSTTVRPQPVTEQSLMESVAGFINEVQAFNQPGTDPKSQVTWARFELADINDPTFYSEGSGGDANSPPLLLALGFSQGVQVWLIPGSGEAKLVLSWFHGQVKALRILPSPELHDGTKDPYSQSRPLVALCDSAGPGPAFMSVSFVSLLTGEQVNNIKFSCEVADICVNRRVVCAAFRERVAIFDAVTLKDRATITSCYPSPGVHTNPLALHDRWLAYGDRALCVARRSAGGMEGEIGQSVTAWGINVGSKLASGVTKVVSNIFSGSPRAGSMSTNMGAGAGGAPGGPDGVAGETGVVTILDMVDLASVGDVEMEGGQNIDIANSKVEGVVAHFVAHTRAIVGLQWDPSGSLLLTADKPGHNFNMFRVVAHPLGSAFAAVHHLYTLYRGDTPGSVQDIAFSSDSRWVTVSTLRGTTHIFPVCPYGGAVGVRTHTSHRVVNKLSRFHRSAGLNETPPHQQTSSGRNSPNPTLGSSPGSSKGFEFPPGIFLGQPVAYPSPHLPPYPSPTLVQPIAQLKQPYIVTLTSQVSLGGGRKPVHGKRNSVPEEVPIRLAVTFGPSRARVLQGVHSGYPRVSKKAMDSLFVMANHGQLLEYSLDPVPEQTIPKDKVCESSPIELNIVAYGQWNLGKQGGKDRTEVAPPLEPSNPLLLSKEQLGPQESNWPLEDSEDRWLSQVEIVSHVGPARRLWMGPQFSFRTFQHVGQREDDLDDMNVTITCRPQQSEPMQMPGGSPIHGSKKPVFIECGSANSFELSPRFANIAIRGSRENVPLEMDVESELREAMSDTGGRRAAGDPDRKIGGRPAEGEEEFFCLSTEDVRSTPTIHEGPRTRNSSGISQPRSRHTSNSSLRPVEMVTADTKIFSVAVQQGKAGDTALRNLVLKDVENQMMDRPVILSKKEVVEQDENVPGGQVDNSEDEFKPVQRDTEEHLPGFVESKDLLGELESALSQEAAAEEETEAKKVKKSKKKNKVVDLPPSSSADEMKEVEIKPKKKKNKSKDKEKEERKEDNIDKEKTPPVFEKKNSPEIQQVKEPTNSNNSMGQSSKHISSNKFIEKDDELEKLEEFVITKQPSSSDIFKEETPVRMCQEFSEAKVSYEDYFSPDKDLVEFSEEEGAKAIDIDDNEDSEKVDFFIREKSSSVDPDEEMQTSSSKIDPLAAKPNPWLDDFLKKSSTMVEDHIFGAVKKYEDTEEKYSDDEGMVELEKKNEITEKNIADLLEDDEEQPKKNVVEKISSSLSQLLKGDSRKSTPPKESINDDTSDDDFMFRPVPNKRNKKKQKAKSVESEEEFYRCQGDGSAADSESEKVSEQDPCDSVTADTEAKDGWSFEVDEKDVNKLLETEETPKETVATEEEERTALEDVFRFDSEIREEESQTPLDNKTADRTVSVDDLNDALMDETDDSEAEGARPVEKEKSTNGMSSVTSSSYGTSCGTSNDSASESSTTNSPNPRVAQSNKQKNKKGKKKGKR